MSFWSLGFEKPLRVETRLTKIDETQQQVASRGRFLVNGSRRGLLNWDFEHNSRKLQIFRSSRKVWTFCGKDNPDDLIGIYVKFYRVVWLDFVFKVWLRFRVFGQVWRYVEEVWFSLTSTRKSTSHILVYRKISDRCACNFECAIIYFCTFNSADLRVIFLIFSW